MYASKPDYHLSIVHAQHTTFLKLTTTMLHILTLQKKKESNGWSKKGFNHTTINTHKPALK